MLFWKLPDNKYLAFIPKTGSTAWSQAILEQFYPDLKPKQLGATTPSGEIASCQYIIPFVKKVPAEGEVYGIFRDPIERFKSGSIAISNNINKNIDSLKNSKVNIHIKSMHDMFGEDINKIQWFKYETDLPKLYKAISLNKMPRQENTTNVSLKKKIKFNAKQLEKLNLYYKADMEFYNKL